MTEIIDRKALGQEQANGRVRHRQGRARIRRGVPYADPASTLSLLPGAARGEWLADVREVFSGRLLDAGAGNQPYREWYAPMVDKVIAVDAAPIEGLSALAYAERLPFADASFDTVLSTEVWEHVEDPGQAARESFRVLRPGGYLVVTVPFFYPTHEAPYDFGRFTWYGLTAILRTAGFEVVRVDAEGGPLLFGTHMCVLAVTQALNAVGRLFRLRRPLSTLPGLRHLLAAPQQALIALRYRLRGPRRGIRFGAGLMTLGYFPSPANPRPRRPLNKSFPSTCRKPLTCGFATRAGRNRDLFSTLLGLTARGPGSRHPAGTTRAHFPRPTGLGVTSMAAGGTW